MPLRVLVVGGDSVLGAGFVAALAQSGEVVYSTTRRADTAAGTRLYLDLADPAAEAIDLPRVDVAFFCAAVSGFSICRANPLLARQVNVTGTGALARRLVAQDTHVVLLSSTAVFDFSTPHFRPDTPVCPRTLHGELKAEGERLFLALGAAGSVLRLTKVLTPQTRLFTDWITALDRGDRVEAFSDLHIAPLTLEDAVAALFAVAGDRAGGIYQVSGARDISYAAAARHLAQRLELDPRVVEETRAVDQGIPAPEVPRYTSLECSRLHALTGRRPPEPLEVLDSVYGPLIQNLAKQPARPGR